MASFVKRTFPPICDKLTMLCYYDRVRDVDPVVEANRSVMECLASTSDVHAEHEGNLVPAAVRGRGTGRWGLTNGENA